MDKILLLTLSTFIAVVAWLTRFAIKEYPVFKRLKIPSAIFKNGAGGLAIFILWNTAAHQIHSKMLPFVPLDKIDEMEKSIVLMADKNTIYFCIGSWVFLWFCAIIIDEFAKSINKARAKEKEKTE